MALKVQDTGCGKKTPGDSGGYRVCCCLSLLLAMLVVSCGGLQPKPEPKCVSQNNLEKKDHAPIGQQGSILLVDEPSQAQPMQQVFVAAFQFKGDTVEAQELRIVAGTGKIPYSQKCDFQFELVDVEENLLAKYGIWDPRILIADEDEKTGFVEVPTATFVARFPFTANAKEIRVLNAQNKIVAGKDVRAAIKEFCGKHKGHPACRSVMLK
jgi:hypothetical protein